ncbi:MAG: CBS domain-containing protein, partial [Dolichospermum sp.]
AAVTMTQERTRSALIIDDQGRLVGILSLEDIKRTLSLRQNIPNLPPEIHGTLSTQKLIDICTTDILYAWVDEPLSEALNRMALRGLHQLPVVSRENPDFILGLLEFRELELTCNITAITKALHSYLPVLPVTDIEV